MKEIISALAKAKGSFGAIGKSKTAKLGSYSYKYAPLDEVIEATQTALAANGLAIVHRVTPEGLETTLWHESGECLPPSLFPLPDGKDAKAIGGAITYGRRYNTCALLDLAIEDDLDAQHLSGSGEKNDRPPKSLASLNLATPAQLKRLHARREEIGVSLSDAKIIVAQVLDCAVEDASSKNLNQTQYAEAYRLIEELGSEQKKEQAIIAEIPV